MFDLRASPSTAEGGSTVRVARRTSRYACPRTCTGTRASPRARPYRRTSPTTWRSLWAPRPVVPMLERERPVTICCCPPEVPAAHVPPPRWPPHEEPGRMMPAPALRPPRERTAVTTLSRATRPPNPSKPRAPARSARRPSPSRYAVASSISVRHRDPRAHPSVLVLRRIERQRTVVGTRSAQIANEHGSVTGSTCLDASRRSRRGRPRPQPCDPGGTCRDRRATAMSATFDCRRAIAGSSSWWDGDEWNGRSRMASTRGTRLGVNQAAAGRGGRSLVNWRHARHRRS